MARCEIVEDLDCSTDTPLSTLNLSSIYRRSFDASSAMAVSRADLAELLQASNDKLAADLKKSFKTQFDRVEKSINEIKHDLSALRNKVSDTETRIDLLDAKCVEMETDIARARGTNTFDLTHVVSEIEDRNRRSNNLLLLGLAEESDVAANPTPDKDRVIQILSSILSTNSTIDIHLVVRLGKKIPQKNRPIKIILSSPTIVKDILKKTRIKPIAGLKFVNDLTILQKKELTDLRSQLEAKGDDSQTIRYIRGRPCIAPKLGNGTRQQSKH